jgi:hypothetical protein
VAGDPDRKLEYRVVPADAPPDHQVLDDLIRLVRQGIATASDKYPQVSDGSGFRTPDPGDQRDLGSVEAKVKHRIEQASQESQAAVAERAKLAARPDSDQKLADEARKAAELVVSAVQRALLRGVRVQVPPDPPPPAADG